MIRPASPDDLPLLVTLMAEFYAESGFPLNCAHASAALAVLLADERLGSIWIMEAEAAPAGYVVLTLCFSMEYGGMAGTVDDLFVRPAFRKRRLATQALATLREHCEQRGVRALHVETGDDNAAALAVYRNAGFTPTQRQFLTLPLATPVHA